jgi:ubiquinone/menaquinone biosynthesis C-methylase UbiE
MAAGAGEQTLVTARRVGPSGYVLATDISANLLEFAAAEVTLIRKSGQNSQMGIRMSGLPCN